ncbi:MAG: RnfH family protein [Gammaproteobacteria bacterium]|nr:RnfH family protein [Gammaproteobacteria bacterium]
MFWIEVSYALKHEQVILKLEVDAPTTVTQAIERSGIVEQYPEIDLSRNKVGIFGKLCKMDAMLREGDRVEIYRALIADPKEIRRQRAAEGKKMKKGASE